MTSYPEVNLFFLDLKIIWWFIEKKLSRSRELIICLNHHGMLYHSEVFFCSRAFQIIGYLCLEEKNSPTSLNVIDNWLRKLGYTFLIRIKPILNGNERLLTSIINRLSIYLFVHSFLRENQISKCNLVRKSLISNYNISYVMLIKIFKGW